MRRESVIAVSVSLGLAASAEAADLFTDDSFTPTVAAAPKWGAWASLGGAWGTNESSFGELIIFAPLMQTPDSLTFTEFRAKYFEGDILEGNAALGYRWMSPSGFNFGVWAGLDVRHTDSDNTFGQVSGGLEALSEYFDFRVNGYLPFTDPQTADNGMTEVKLDGSNIFMIGGEEVALYGVDGEIGARLPLFASNAVTLGVYGGGFWFDHDEAYEAISGGKARVELAVTDLIGAGSEITAQYAYSHDNVRGDRHFVGGALRIPLGATTPARDLTAQQWRMLDGLERDTDIVIGQSDEEPVEDVRTGTDFDEVIRVDADGELPTALASGPDKLIVVDDIGGAYTGNLTVGPYQTVQGGGSTINVRGLNSGVVADFTAPGTRPTIDADAGAVITVADRVHLAGLDITGGGTGVPASNDGVFGAPGIFVALSDLDVSGLGGSAFDFEDANGTTALFRDVHVSDTGSVGIEFSNSEDAIVDFTGVWVSNTGGRGIDFSSAAGAMVDFHGVWVSDTGFDGIGFTAADGAQADFANVYVSDTGAEGIDFADAAGATADFHEVSVTNADREGISFANADGATVGFDNVMVSGAGFEGISFNSAGGAEVTFTDVHVVDAFQGIDFGIADGAKVSFTDVHVSGIEFQGIDFSGADGATAEFHQASVSDTGFAGIDFGDADGTDVTFDDVEVSNTGTRGVSGEGAGINFSFSPVPTTAPVVSFKNVRVSETFEEGITFNNADGAQADFTNVHVSDTGAEGIDFADAAGATADFHEVSVTNADREGISFANADGAVVDLRMVEVSGAGFEGISFNSAGGAEVTLTDVRVSGAFQGIDFGNADGAEVSFTDVHVSDTAFQGIEFGGADGAMADFHNVHVSDTGAAGIDFSQADDAQATFDKVTFAGTIGNAGNNTDTLFRAGGAPLPTINGDIVNNTDNVPPGDLCQPANGFTGVVTVTNGGITTITDGDACVTP